MESSNPGKLLMLIRNARGHSQPQVERRSGISQYRISRIEHGHEPTFFEVCALARTLRFSLDALMWCVENDQLDLQRCLLPDPGPTEPENGPAEPGA